MCGGRRRSAGLAELARKATRVPSKARVAKHLLHHLPEAFRRTTLRLQRQPGPGSLHPLRQILENPVLQFQDLGPSLGSRDLEYEGRPMVDTL